MTRIVGWARASGLVVALLTSATVRGHERLPCEALYRRVVFDGFADYERLAKDPALKACSEALAAARPETLGRSAQLTFWVNAYNLLTLFVIAEDPERWSAQQDGVALFRDRRFSVGGKQHSLDEIERTEIAALSRDPRVEFLLSCGARSCALLPPRLVTPEALDAAMETGARRWFARRENLQVNRAAGTVEVGQLLQPDWHGGDFERAGIPLVELVARFLAPKDPDAARALRTGKLRLVFIPYDWRVNRLPRAYPLP